MSTLIETRAQAWRRRDAKRGDVDFTMMYVGHDAFSRDLERLVAAAERGEVLSPPARGTWELFSRMLQVHHGAEDVALWPALHAAVDTTEDAAILDAMEAEHAAIDPLLDAVTAGFAQGRAADVAHGIHELRGRLSAHLVHEEDDALPLLERTFGQPGWAAFGEEIRREFGMKEMARMLPWLLDDAREPAAETVLGLVPGPIRVLHRTVWAPAYRRAVVLH